MERLKLHINETGTNPQELKKQYLKSFFSELRRTSHHIYVLLENLPLPLFALVRYYDHRQARRDGMTYRETTDVYTLREFYSLAGQFHKYDEFRVMFYGNIFYFEAELTPAAFGKYYARFLYCECERALRRNAPILLTRESIREYGLTRNSAKIVNSYLDLYNTAAIEKIRAEYEALRTLDCVII